MSKESINQDIASKGEKNKIDFKTPLTEDQKEKFGKSTKTIEKATKDSETDTTIIDTIKIEAFPVPCRENTKFSFFIEKGKEMPIKFELYDILGNEINTKDINIKPGEDISYNINPKELKLSEGVYYYRIHANGKSITKKLFVFKEDEESSENLAKL